MLYQGEDITIKLTGDEIVDFVNNDFKAILYQNDKGMSDNVIELWKSDFSVSEDNSCTYTIPSNVTKNMQGMYSIEVMLIGKNGGKRSIYKQDNILTVEYSRIKDY